MAFPVNVQATINGKGINGAGFKDHNLFLTITKSHIDSLDPDMVFATYTMKRTTDAAATVTTVTASQLKAESLKRWPNKTDRYYLPLKAHFDTDIEIMKVEVAGYTYNGRTYDPVTNDVTTICQTDAGYNNARIDFNDEAIKVARDGHWSGMAMRIRDLTQCFITLQEDGSYHRPFRHEGQNTENILPVSIEHSIWDKWSKLDDAEPVLHWTNYDEAGTVLKELTVTKADAFAKTLFTKDENRMVFAEFIKQSAYNRITVEVSNGVGGFKLLEFIMTTEVKDSKIRFVKDTPQRRKLYDAWQESINRRNLTVDDSINKAIVEDTQVIWNDVPNAANGFSYPVYLAFPRGHIDDTYAQDPTQLININDSGWLSAQQFKDTLVNGADDLFYYIFSTMNLGPNGHLVRNIKSKMSYEGTLVEDTYLIEHKFVKDVDLIIGPHGGPNRLKNCWLAEHKPLSAFPYSDDVMEWTGANTLLRTVNTADKSTPLQITIPARWVDAIDSGTGQSTALTVVVNNGVSSTPHDVSNNTIKNNSFKDSWFYVVHIEIPYVDKDCTVDINSYFADLSQDSAIVDYDRTIRVHRTDEVQRHKLLEMANITPAEHDNLVPLMGPGDFEPGKRRSVNVGTVGGRKQIDIISSENPPLTFLAVRYYPGDFVNLADDDPAMTVNGITYTRKQLNDKSIADTKSTVTRLTGFPFDQSQAGKTTIHVKAHIGEDRNFAPEYDVDIIIEHALVGQFNHRLVMPNSAMYAKYCEAVQSSFVHDLVAPAFAKYNNANVVQNYYLVNYTGNFKIHGQRNIHDKRSVPIFIEVDKDWITSVGATEYTVLFTVNTRFPGSSDRITSLKLSDFGNVPGTNKMVAPIKTGLVKNPIGGQFAPSCRINVGSHFAYNPGEPEFNHEINYTATDEMTTVYEDKLMVKIANTPVNLSISAGIVGKLPNNFHHVVTGVRPVSQYAQLEMTPLRTWLRPSFSSSDFTYYTFMPIQIDIIQYNAIKAITDENAVIMSFNGRNLLRRDIDTDLVSMAGQNYYWPVLVTEDMVDSYHVLDLNFGTLGQGQHLVAFIGDTGLSIEDYEAITVNGFSSNQEQYEMIRRMRPNIRNMFDDYVLAENFTTDRFNGTAYQTFVRLFREDGQTRVIPVKVRLGQELTRMIQEYTGDLDTIVISTERVSSGSDAPNVTMSYRDILESSRIVGSQFEFAFPIWDGGFGKWGEALIHAKLFNDEFEWFGGLSYVSFDNPRPVSGLKYTVLNDHMYGKEFAERFLSLDRSKYVYADPENVTITDLGSDHYLVEVVFPPDEAFHDEKLGLITIAVPNYAETFTAFEGSPVVAKLAGVSEVYTEFHKTKAQESVIVRNNTLYMPVPFTKNDFAHDHSFTMAFAPTSDIYDEIEKEIAFTIREAFTTDKVKTPIFTAFDIPNDLYLELMDKITLPNINGLYWHKPTKISVKLTQNPQAPTQPYHDIRFYSNANSRGRYLVIPMEISEEMYNAILENYPDPSRATFQYWDITGGSHHGSIADMRNLTTKGSDGKYYYCQPIVGDSRGRRFISNNLHHITIGGYSNMKWLGINRADFLRYQILATNSESEV